MTRFNMNQLATTLELPPRYFVTRDKGEVAHDVLEVALSEMAEEKSLILEFPPGQIMDVSFADETIIRIGQAIIKGQFGRKRLLLQGLNQDSIDNIEGAIRLQRLKLAFLAIAPSMQWQVIGHLEESQLEVLTMLSHRYSMTAPELAAERNLALNSANNRLKRLFDHHLIKRNYEVSEKGLVYIYQFWQWDTESEPYE